MLDEVHYAHYIASRIRHPYMNEMDYEVFLAKQYDLDTLKNLAAKVEAVAYALSDLEYPNED